DFTARYPARAVCQAARARSATVVNLKTYGWITMLPARSVPPSIGPVETEMVKASAAPGSPLSVTFTSKVHGAPLRVQVPKNRAVLPTIANDVNATLCSLAAVA